MRGNAIFIHTWSPSRRERPQLEGWISSSVIVTLNKLASAAFSAARLCRVPSRNDKLQNNCLTFPTDDSTAVFRHERVSRSWGRMKMTFHWFIRCCRLQCTSGLRLLRSPTYRLYHASLPEARKIFPLNALKSIIPRTTDNWISKCHSFCVQVEFNFFWCLIWVCL